MQILETFNETKGNGKFEPVESTLKLIRGRLKEGHAPDELMAVARFMHGKTKTDDWWRKNKKFFRPQTIYNGEKYQAYRQEYLEREEKQQYKEREKELTGDQMMRNLFRGT